MRYRDLGKTGIKASVIALGTHQFSGEWGIQFSAADVDQIMGRAGELGINVVDTAECYGDHSVEAMIGEAIHSRRDKWIVATKFGHISHGSFKKTDAWSPADVLKQLDTSLSALRSDYVDIYQFHSGGNAVFDNDALWEVLNRQVMLGKIRHLGISLSGELTIKGDIHQLKQAIHYGVGVVQVVYNRLSREAEVDILPFCKENRLGVFGRIPLSRGFLSGKYVPGVIFPKGDIRSTTALDFNEKRLREVDVIRRTEVPENMNMAQWALSWCLAQPALTGVIVGCKNISQLETNAAVGVNEL